MGAKEGIAGRRRREAVYWFGKGAGIVLISYAAGGGSPNIGTYQPFPQRNLRNIRRNSQARATNP